MSLPVRGGRSQKVQQIGGKWIAAGRDDTTIKVRVAPSGQETLSVKELMSCVTSFGLKPIGKRIVNRSYDSAIRVWDVPR